jgi:GNAT superfamily N-acetyltransferase/predicted nucleic acid-binding protein
VRVYIIGAVRFIVLNSARDVASFVEVVQRCADLEKDALGFLPEVAYSQAAASGKLMIAVHKSGDSAEYAGHLLFGGTYPHCRVFQVYVVQRFRRQKIASLLIQSLVRGAEERGYLTVSAKVASDLEAANAFYEGEGLTLVRCTPGGSTRGRILNIRQRELDTPTLFGVGREPLTAQSSGFPLRDAAPIPSYTIDVNVFLDLMKNRANAEQVRRTIAASLTRAVDVFVSDEFLEELRRAGNRLQQDPLIDFASALPRLPKIPMRSVEPIVAKLGMIVFPDKAKRNALSERDVSDLVHLATVVHHGMTGFVTGEIAILRHAHELRREFGIDVLGTVEFSSMVAPRELRPTGELRSGTEGDELSVLELAEEDRGHARVFLERLGIPGPLLTTALSPGASPLNRRRILVRTLPSGSPIGYASWAPPTLTRSRNEAYVFVDENHSDAWAIATHLFWEITRDVASSGPCVIILKNPPGHATARSVAVGVGFRLLDATPGAQNELQRVSLGGAVSVANWAKVSITLKALLGLELPSEMPTFTGADTTISFVRPDGTNLNLRLRDAEKLFGTLFLLPGRPGILVPIRREYADHLFSGAPQLSLLPRKQAALYSERVYFRSPARARTFELGSPVVFYESLPGGGRGGAFASGVVATNRVVWAETLSERVLLKGVLDRETIIRMSRKGLISMMTFEGAISFRKTVRLSRLRAINAIDGANLVAPRRLQPAELALLYSEAEALAL